VGESRKSRSGPDDETKALRAQVAELEEERRRLGAVQKSLQESERKFRLLAENVPGVIYVCRNDERYTMIYLNDQVEAVTGHPKEAFLSDRVSFVELYHPDDVANIVQEVNAAVAARRSFHLIYRILHPSGQWRWVDEFGTGVYDDRTQELLFLEGFLHDITERKYAEEALRESVERYRTVVEFSPDCIYWRTPEHRLAYVAPASERVTGYTAEEFMASPQLLDEIVYPEDRSLWKDHCHARMPNGSPRPMEFRIITKEGQIRWVSHVCCPIYDDYGTPLGERGSHRDITERKLAEEELHRERRLFTGGPVVVFRWIAEEGWPVEYVSPNVAQLFGHSREEFTIGRLSYASIVHPHDLQRVAEEVTTFTQSGVPCFEQYYRIVRPDGSSRWLYDFTVFARDDTGRVTHYEGYVLDITERKQAEEELARHRDHLQELVRERTAELEKSQEQLRRTDRLAALGSLAAGIAHEIENPLGVILMDAQIALRFIDQPSVTEQSLKQMADQTRRCIRAVKSLLQFAREETTKKWPADLNALVLRAQEAVQKDAEQQGIAISLDLAEGLPLLPLNAAGVEQVFVNVLKNAVQACTQKGHISVSTVRLSDCIQAVVRDDGCGMSEAERQRAFDPFYSSRPDIRSGLGLSIALGIVSEHGGTITIASEPGEGTTVTISFPLSIAEPTDTAADI
jgi:PAS domain S-box-containing protein